MVKLAAQDLHQVLRVFWQFPTQSLLIPFDKAWNERHPAGRSTGAIRCLPAAAIFGHVSSSKAIKEKLFCHCNQLGKNLRFLDGSILWQERQSGNRFAFFRETNVVCTDSIPLQSQDIQD